MFKNFDITKVNLQKVAKTTRGSIKKAIFYLNAKIPYAFTINLVNLSSLNIKDYMLKDGKEIEDLLALDAKIRFCDDILDNDLSRISPKPIKEMLSVIEKFEKDVPEAKRVAELFSLELDISNNVYKKAELEGKIKELIEIRPCDYFILVDKIIKNFGTNLSAQDLRYSTDFYKEFQRLRDLLEDMMSIEEDTIKNDYNSVILAKNRKIPYSFFDEIVTDKFSKMELSAQKINNHPNKNIFFETIDFWKKEYKLLFKKLLMDYYIDIEEFKKSYFIIKQL